MSLQAILKAEISRLARREVTAALKQTRKLVAQHRHLIAKQRRQIEALERALASVSRSRRAAGPAASLADVEATGGVGKGRNRFSATGLRSFRKRLGLSAAELGAVMGVTEQAIYNWEATTRPRAESIQRLARLRVMGVRKIRELVEQSSQQKRASRSVASVRKKAKRRRAGRP